MSVRGMLLVVGVVASASVANAAVIASFRYDSLSGSYDASTGQFEAHASGTGPLQSTGSVTRLVGTTGTAEFEPGFVAASNPADFRILLSSSATANPNVRSGNGSFEITDADGDKIVGEIIGTWRNSPTSIFFNGILSNVFVVAGQQTNGTFDGTLQGLFPLAFAEPAPYTGAVVELVYGAPGFFTQSFSDRVVGVTGQIVPTPGALALVGMGGLVIGRRRR